MQLPVRAHRSKCTARRQPRGTGLSSQGLTMPTMTEMQGAAIRRFRWSKLRFQYGFWRYYTIPEAGLGWREWQWVEH